MGDCNALTGSGSCCLHSHWFLGRLYQHAIGQQLLLQLIWRRCQQWAAASSSGTLEICGNLVDDDRDGITDETSDVHLGSLGYNEVCDSPDDADRCPNGIVKCDNQQPRCIGDTPTPELCGNALDDNCDGTTDEGACVTASDAGP